MDPEIRMDKHDLVAGGNFLDVLDSKTSCRVDKSCNDVVPSFPDNIPKNGLRDPLLAASDMAHAPSLTKRVRKRTKHRSCPLIPLFQKKIMRICSSAPKTLLLQLHL